MFRVVRPCLSVSLLNTNAQIASLLSRDKPRAGSSFTDCSVSYGIWLIVAVLNVIAARLYMYMAWPRKGGQTNTD